MYISELLDPSEHRSHMCFPHQLKGISSQWCWMIMIGCRTDGYWKSGGWLFPDCFGTRKRGFVTLFETHLQPDHPSVLFPPYSFSYLSSIIVCTIFLYFVWVCMHSANYHVRSRTRPRKMAAYFHWWVWSPSNLVSLWVPFTPSAVLNSLYNLVKENRKIWVSHSLHGIHKIASWWKSK